MLFLVAKPDNRKNNDWQVYPFGNSEDLPKNLEWDKMFASRKNALNRIKELNTENKKIF